MGTVACIARRFYWRHTARGDTLQIVSVRINDILIVCIVFTCSSLGYFYSHNVSFFPSYYS